MHNSAPDRMPSVDWNMRVWKSLCIRYEKFFILFTLKLCLQLRYYNFYGCSIRLLESGGWDTLHQWLNEYKELDEVPVLVLLLQTFQKLPVSMDLLKANTTAKIVKSLRKHSHEGLFLIDFINGVLCVHYKCENQELKHSGSLEFLVMKLQVNPRWYFNHSNIEREQLWLSG